MNFMMLSQLNLVQLTNKKRPFLFERRLIYTWILNDVQIKATLTDLSHQALDIIMGRRSDHSREELQAMAVDAAAMIVESEGFHSLTARKVAGKIGYTVGTLYHVFRNFDDLVIHVNARTIDDMAALIQSAVKRKRNPVSRIKTMGEVYVDYASEHPDLWRLVFEHQAPRGLPTPERMKVRRDVMFELVAENLRECSPHHSDQEVNHTATALWSGVHGICILALTGKLYLGGAFSMNKLIDTLIDAVLNDFRHKRG